MIVSVPRNDYDHWLQILGEARGHAQLRETLAEFMVANRVVLSSERDSVTGITTYSVRFDRPHIAEVERAEGRKHWVVNERGVLK